MLLKHAVLEAIAAGEVTLVFRRWKRPTVKTGGTLKTRIGLLAIDAVDALSSDDITEEDAARAGFADRAALLEALSGRDGQCYRIALHVAGPDPRVALRATTPNARELEGLRDTLAKMDARSKGGPWTRQYLELIRDRPATLALDLAQSIGMEKKPFKARVRRLKELGLTVSLKVGYQLSTRGASYLEHATSAPG